MRRSEKLITHTQKLKINWSTIYIIPNLKSCLASSFDFSTLLESTAIHMQRHYTCLRIHDNHPEQKPHSIQELQHSQVL